MSDFLFGTPEQDPDLGDALRRLESGRSTAEDDDLRARISAAAEPALRARRLAVRESYRAWWEWTSSWARLAIPAGAAVAVVSALLLTKAKAPSSTEAAADSAAVSSLLVSAGDDRSGGALLDQVLVPAERDWLFSQAMVSTRPES